MIENVDVVRAAWKSYTDSLQKDYEQQKEAGTLEPDESDFTQEQLQEDVKQAAEYYLPEGDGALASRIGLAVEFVAMLLTIDPEFVKTLREEVDYFRGPTAAVARELLKAKLEQGEEVQA